MFFRWCEGTYQQIQSQQITYTWQITQNTRQPSQISVEHWLIISVLTNCPTSTDPLRTIPKYLPYICWLLADNFDIDQQTTAIHPENTLTFDIDQPMAIQKYCQPVKYLLTTGKKLRYWPIANHQPPKNPPMNIPKTLVTKMRIRCASFRIRDAHQMRIFFNFYLMRI